MDGSLESIEGRDHDKQDGRPGERRQDCYNQDSPRPTRCDRPTLGRIRHPGLCGSAFWHAATFVAVMPFPVAGYLGSIGGPGVLVIVRDKIGHAQFNAE